MEADESSGGKNGAKESEGLPHRLHAGVLEHLREMLHSSRPTGCDHRDRHRSHDSLGTKSGGTQGSIALVVLSAGNVKVKNPDGFRYDALYYTPPLR